jgi:hypothetical protein
MEAFLLTGMTCHGCRPWEASLLTGMTRHGSRPWEASLLTGMTRHGCRPWEAYLLPFLCQGRALVEVKVAQTPFGIFPPLIRVNPTPRVGRGEVLSWGVERGETHARGVRRGGTLSRGSGEPGTSSVGLDWAVATLTIILGGWYPTKSI